MSLATFLRHLRRESRGGRGRLTFFVACLALGVAAVVAVAGFAEGIERGIRGEARQLLAADLAVRGRQPIPEVVHRAVGEIDGARATRVLELLTLAAAPVPQEPAAGAARSLLVELKSLDGEYPFYGELELDSPRSLTELLDAGTVIAAPEVLARLQLARGDTLRLGGEAYRIAGTVLAEPDRITGAFSMGPRVFVSAAGLKRAGLVQHGSRVLHRTLIRLPPEADVDAVAGRLRELLHSDGRHRVETFRQAQPQLRRGLRRGERYLGLAALLSLLIGGVGVAQTVRAWLAGRMDAIAVLKCLGYRPREVLWLYLGQTAVLGLIGSLAGIVLGVAVQLAGARLLQGTLPVEYLDPFQPWALARGLALGLGTSLLFSLPPIAAARRVPPIRVLRRDAEPLPPSRWARLLTGGMLIAGVAVLAAWQARSWAQGALFAAGLTAAAALLAGGAVLLTRLAGRPRAASRLWLRHGLAALERPGAATVGATTALGLGVLVVLAMFLVERGLSDQLRRDLPRGAPSVFLIDIQPDQWPGVAALLEAADAAGVESVPLVMGRVHAIDGESSTDLLEQRRRGGRDGNWALRREQRLTYRAELPPDNVIVDGALWGRPEVAELSVEQEFARYLGVGVGSRVTFDVQGVLLDLVVSSLRTVEWGSFALNFYLVVEPGVLEEAPQLRVAAAALPRDREQAVQDRLAAAFPNVTLIRVREVLEKVAATLERLGLGVRLLGGLTVAAGLAILAGAVAAGAVRRGREVALYKTLGMTRRQVLAAFAAEYALIGAVAGLLGAGGGGLLAQLVLRYGLEVEWTVPPAWLLAAAGATVLLAVAAGLLASTPALQQRPARVLRGLGS